MAGCRVTDPRFAEYRGLVVKIAARWKSRLAHLYDFDDLVSIGNVALWGCMQRWDAKLASFGTYAYAAINGELQQLYRKSINPIRFAPMLSIDAGYDKENDGAFTFDLRDERESQLSQLDKCRSMAALDRSISALQEPHREVIRRRLSGETHPAIGRALGVCRERVRQLEVEAVATLRKRNAVFAR